MPGLRMRSMNGRGSSRRSPSEPGPTSHEYSPLAFDQVALRRKVARPAGLEPATPGLEGRCSIQVSYGRVQRQRIELYDDKRKSDNDAMKTMSMAIALVLCAAAMAPRPAAVAAAQAKYPIELVAPGKGP